MSKVTVIGAGLAGCEAAYYLAQKGVNVDLIEMKPHKKSEAHSSNNFAELVCSNSLRSNSITNAVGLLKQEMRVLNSLIIQAADNTAVAAGGALAVDRDMFSDYITEKIKNHKNINVLNCEASKPTGDICIIATGPLTSDKMFDTINEMTGGQNLHFFDAAAPIVHFDSIDKSQIFYQNRYDKGESLDYVNCPLDEQQYNEFYNGLVNAKRAYVKDFESKKIFEGCMPIEEMAARGVQSMRYGMLKPKGLTDPRTQKRPYAVVQLRKENNYDTLYNLVGFQTRLTFDEQKRVFGIIPALKNAVYARYGVMHRNTFINSPNVLTKHYNMIANPSIYFAGQISGVEGYCESASSGLLAAINVYRQLNSMPVLDYDNSSAITALACYISTQNKNFQPMNVNFGIIKQQDIKDKENRKIKTSNDALEYVRKLI